MDLKVDLNIDLPTCLIGPEFASFRTIDLLNADGTISKRRSHRELVSHLQILLEQVLLSESVDSSPQVLEAYEGPHVTPCRVYAVKELQCDG